MPPFLLRFWVLVKRVVKSTWMVPVLCVAAALLYAAVIGPHAALRSASHAWALLGEVAAALALLSFALLLVWLVGSMFLKQTFGQRGLRVLFSLLGGGTALVIVVGVSLFESLVRTLFLLAGVSGTAFIYGAPYSCCSSSKTN